MLDRLGLGLERGDLGIGRGAQDVVRVPGLEVHLLAGERRQLGGRLLEPDVRDAPALRAQADVGERRREGLGDDACEQCNEPYESSHRP